MDKLRAIANSRYFPWILIGLGVIRNLMLLGAYPPAHGADSLGFFFYAQRLSGFALPGMGRAVYPLYPVLIWVTTGGSVYVLIAVQFVMAVAVAPLYYLAVKPYSPLLAMIVGIAMLLDFQVAILFDFTFSEPLYVFVMALTLYTFFRTARRHCERGWCTADVLTGALLVLLLLTRSVARFMLPAFLVVIWLVARNWRRPLAMLMGFVAAYGVWAIVSLALLGRVEGMAAQEYFLWGVYPNQFARDLSADNGPESEIYLEARETCPADGDLAIAYCLEDMTGSWSGALSVLRGTTLETIEADPHYYFNSLLQESAHLLANSGLIFAYPGGGIASEVQCESTKAQAGNGELTANRITAGLVDPSPEKLDEIRDLEVKFRSIMCPPLLKSNPILKQVVDQLSLVNLPQIVSYRYFDEEARFQSDRWYELDFIYFILPVLTLLFPWARKFAPMVLGTMGFLALHALAGGVVFVVQPARFAVVTNPLRALLLLYLIYVGVRIFVQYLYPHILTALRPTDGVS